MATIFCSKCGTPNADDSRFCSKCGAPLQAVASQPASQGHNAQSQAKQQPSHNTSPERKKPGLKTALIAIAVLAVAAGIFFGVRALGGGGEDKGYYEIGGERVPSVSYALGEARKLQSMKDSSSNGVETLSLVYNVSSAQGDMRAYAGYLQSKDGFSLRTAGVSFEQKTGSGIQLWRNAEASGFMVIVQLDYDEKGYTVTVMRGAGQTSGGAAGSTAPTPGSTEAAPDMPASSPSAGGNGTGSELTGNPEIDALVRSVTPPDGIYTRVEERSIGVKSPHTYQDVMKWYEGKLPELGFVDTMPDQYRAELDANSGQYNYWGTVNGQEILIALTSHDALDGNNICIITLTIPKH